MIPKCDKPFPLTSLPPSQEKEKEEEEEERKKYQNYKLYNL
jgi:hypothetical protein